ncbi:hypothetical protein GJAV_G00049560 [Gymnothorax javanicus]|nr:hypothetical protein GJAV_G00049560 [Gymnothorax javanicus]
MSSSYSVALGGPGPWGFRLQGGKDFNMPLTISRLTDGGKAARAHISVGDVLLSIDGVATEGMNHLEAQNKIKACSGSLKLTLKRASATPKAASTPKDEPREVVNPAPVTKLPPPTAYTPPAPSSIYNKTARPFGGGGGGAAGGGASHVSAPKMASVIPSAASAFSPAGSTHDHAHNQTPPPFSTSSTQNPASTQPTPPFTRSPASTAAVKPSPGRSPLPPPSSSSSPSTWSPATVTGTSPSGPVQSQPSVYNSPINLYSAENASEVAIGQRRGLPQGGTEKLNGSPRRHIIDTEPVLYPTSPSDSSRKRLVEDTEDWHPHAGTGQSRSFRLLAQITGTEHQDDQQGRL